MHMVPRYVRLHKMDLVPSIHKPEYYAEVYPGFPDFVHSIMAHLAQGKTPEQAAKLAGDEQVIQKTLAAIEYVEKTHSTWDAVTPSEVEEIKD